LRPSRTAEEVAFLVREHHAPVGALRPSLAHEGNAEEDAVREHHAPVGALRLVLLIRVAPQSAESGSTTHL